jgi:hypothetical protein
MSRAIHRAYKQKKIDAWWAKKRKHIRDPEAYDKVCEETQRLVGGFLGRRHGVELTLSRAKGLGKSPSHRKPITLAGEQPCEATAEHPRIIAERETLDTLYAAAELLQWHLDVLSHTPNPEKSPPYQNTVSQQRLADLVIRMLECVNLGGRR